MKERIIYNNYDLWEDYAEDCQEYLAEYYPDEEITDSILWDEIYRQDSFNWEDEFYQLKQFFNNSGYFMIRGIVSRWNGSFSAAHIFNDFETMFYEAIKDCDYWKLWDENGHFYLKCSHHDGTNIFEIKKISNKAYNFINNWEYNWEDERPAKQIHDTVWNSNFLSSLPHFAHTVYGCKKYE